MMDTEDKMLTELAKLIDAIKRGLLVPVIRCHDCIYWDDFPSSTAMPDYHRCKMIQRHTRAEQYCDNGERKEKDNG